MRRPTLVLGMTVLLLCGLLGCGGDNYKSRMRQVLKDANNLLIAYKSIKAEEHVETGRPKITAAQDRLQASLQRLAEVQPTAEDEKNELALKYYPVVSSIVGKLQEEVTRLSEFKKVPEPEKFLTKELPIPEALKAMDTAGRQMQVP